MTATEDEILQGQPADPYDCFLLDWGQETVKQTIPRLTEALQRVSTLATAMLGGSLFFLKDDACPPAFRVAAMLAFVAALAAAYHGTLPHTEPMRMNDPRSVERFKAKVADYRSRWLWNASWSLWGGLFLAVMGVLFRMVSLA